MFIPKIKNMVQRALRDTGYSVVPRKRWDEIEAQAAVGAKVATLGMLPDGELRRALALLDKSRSQLNQDFFVLHELGWKRGGYFVEFGATDGKSLSNTLLLEQEFGWTGILAEPARSWRKALESSGRNAVLEFDCVWSQSGEKLTFREAAWAELSTLERFTGSDSHVRQPLGSYVVETVSLNDMLERHNAPELMDYLSIDTEGSEYEILSSLDFQRFRFRCITCEHNFTPNRALIHDLLTSKGYRRRHESFSQFDDWYVLTG